MLNWIRERKNILKIQNLEKEIKIPVDSLRKEYSENNKQVISEDHLPKIYKYLKKLRDSLNEVLRNYEQNKN